MVYTTSKATYKQHQTHKSTVHVHVCVQTEYNWGEPKQAPH